MWMKPSLTSLVIAGLLAAAVSLGADDSARDKELKTFEGEWTAKGEGGSEATYKFTKDKLEITAPSRSYKMTIKIDPAAKPEKSIDFKIDEGPDDAKGKTSRGIYKFEDDNTLIFSFRGEGDRPTEFRQEGFEQILTTLKRKKS